MERLIRTLLSLLLLPASLTMQAQPDFNLFMANNVGSVKNLRRIKDPNSGLNWSQVRNGGFTTNGADVSEVIKMFKDKRQKTRKDQELFWKMRDDNLLCFRIEDGSGKHGVYQVKVVSPSITKTKDVTGYFFINANSRSDSLMISVNKKGCGPNDTLRYKYYINDWNDDNLMVFKLDTRRQETGLTYQLEYVFQAKDSEKKISTGYRELSGKYFQSLYIPNDSTLIDAYLVSNGNRLQLDVKLLQKRVNLSSSLNRLYLSTDFNLDKHQNRELTIFNMLGSGLFLQFDVLHLSVMGKDGVIEPKSYKGNTNIPEGFTFHIAEVDGDGKYVKTAKNLEYLGYDKKEKTHLIRTYGSPCYVEVWPRGPSPAVFKNGGAVDPKTKILNKKRTEDILLLLPGAVTEKGPDVSQQTIYVLMEKKGSTINRDNTNYQVFTIESKDLAVMPSSSAQDFMEDGGFQDPKVVNDEPVTKYAELAISYSVPKTVNGSTIEPKLTLEEKGTTTTHDVTKYTSSVLNGNDYPGFSRSYYTRRWDLVGVIPKTEVDYKPRLKFANSTDTYNGIRYLRRKEFDRKKNSEGAQKEAEKHIFHQLGTTETNYDNEGWGSVVGKFSNVDFRMDNLPGLQINVVPNIDFLRGIYELDVFASLGFLRTTDPDSHSGGGKWRNNIKNTDNLRRFKIGEYGGFNTGANLTDRSKSSTLDKNHWAQHELDDIFNVEVNKLGHGPYIEVHAGFGWRVGSKNQSGDNFALTALEGTGGYGYFMAYRWDPSKAFFKGDAANESWYAKFPIKTIFHVNASALVQANFGFKTYNFKKNGAIALRRLGTFGNVMGQFKAGLGLEIKFNFGSADPDPNDENSKGSWLTRFLYASIGGRVGLKIQATAGYVGLFPKGDLGTRFDLGASVIAIGAGEVYADIRLGPAIRFNPRVSGKLSLVKAWPDDETNPTIPFYPNYEPPKKAPLWLLKRASSLRPTFHIGECIMEDLAEGARPFYLGEDRFIMNNGSATGDMNDNRLVEYDVPEGNNKLNTGTAQPMSPERRMVQNHNAVKVGDMELAVFEEMTREISDADLQGAKTTDQKLDMARYMRIGSSMRAGNDSGWLQYNVAYDENLIDTNPVAAMNIYTDDEDHSRLGVVGDAVCLWKRGNYVLPPYSSEGSEQELQKEKETFENSDLRAFEGDLVLSLFNGEQWSQPESVLKLDKEDILSDYKAVMCNDTVLIALTVLPKDKKQMELRYYCKPEGKPVQYMSTEELNPLKFSLEMVGAVPTIAILHQKDSVNNDIFVKEIDLKGQYKGYGTDLTVSRHDPRSVMIVVDKDNQKPEDFAVVWEAPGKDIYMDGEVLQTDSTQMMLNCSRMYLLDNLTATPHITLGCTADSTTLSGYDVYLDDTKVKVLYALTDLRSGSKGRTWLMKDETYFYEDFQYSISSPRNAIYVDQEMPVNLTVCNTGSTPITHLDGYINDQHFDTQDDDLYGPQDIFINPFSTKTITIYYKMPENFNGMLSAHDVTAVFSDTWAIKKVSRRRGAPETVTKKMEKTVTEYAPGISNMHCELLSHSISGTRNKVCLLLTDDDGLNDNETVHVGLYPSHTDDVPISSTAEVLLKASDFIVSGDQRRAYVELTVDGLEEEQDVEIRARVYNDRVLEALDDDEDDVLDAVVSNLAWQDNQRIITLLPTELDEATGLPVVTKDLKDRKVKVEQTEQGIWISGLEDGDYVRIFDVGGQALYQHSNPSNRLFVPIQERGVYLLSTGQEVVKFTY